MAVAVDTEPTFSKTGLAKELFRGPYFSEIGHMWDISPDGKRFLMLKEAGSAAGPGKINVVLNWPEEFKQRVPAE